MAFDPEAKLSDVLAGGYHLNVKLQALLCRPLDRRGQEEAIAFSQELSRVFMVSMSMLKADESNRVRTTKMAQEIRTGDSFVVCTPAKDKRSNQEGVTSHKNIKEEFITRKEITSSPHSKDGYQWRKYGQKNIQNCSFVRYYYRCNRDRRCAAKKKVQQRDGSSAAHPVFEVTYVNDHTCHDAALLPAATGLPKAAENRGGSAEEEDAIVSCLATVISGTLPSSPAHSVPQQQLPRAEQEPPPSAAMATTIGTGFSWDPSLFCPAPAGAGDVAMDLCCDDVHMDAARFVADTVWPQYYYT